MRQQNYNAVTKRQIPFVLGSIILSLNFFAIGCVETVYQDIPETKNPWKHGKYDDKSTRLQDKQDQTDAQNDIYPWQMKDYPDIDEAFKVFAEDPDQKTDEQNNQQNDQQNDQQDQQNNQGQQEQKKENP